MSAKTWGWLTVIFLLSGVLYLHEEVSTAVPDYSGASLIALSMIFFWKYLETKYFDKSDKDSEE